MVCQHRNSNLIKEGLRPEILFSISLSDVLCLEEMGVVFECFKTYNYNEKKCAQEIMAFNKCVGEARVSLRERKFRVT